MRKYILSLLALVSLLSAMAKTTYIPKYRSYIHIVNGSDTVAVSSSMMDLSLADESGLFNIVILHEDVTKETERIGKELPSYMQPAKIVLRHEEFEKSPSLKIVRK